MCAPPNCPAPQVERSLPRLEERVQQLKAQRDAVEVEDESQVGGGGGMKEGQGGGEMSTGAD